MSSPLLLPIDGLFSESISTYQGLDKRLIAALRAGASATQLCSDQAIILATELAGMDPSKVARQKRDIFLLATSLQIAREQGSTCIDLAEPTLLEHVITLAQEHFAGPKLIVTAEAVITGLRAIVKAEKSPVVGGPDRNTPIIVDGDFAQINRYFRQEKAVLSKIQDLASQKVDAAFKRKAKSLLPDVLQLAKKIGTEDSPKNINHLSNEQSEAVLDAVTHGLSVITGGPGTGKTSIVVSILRLLVRLGVAPQKIALATFTGRAAFRLRETISETMSSLPQKRGGSPDQLIRAMMETNGPQTIHRLLSATADGSEFRNNRRSRLMASWLIIDESSMIDLELMHKVCDALPDEAHLIMLGDVNQLPPIDAGAPFADLIELAKKRRTSGPKIIQLTRNYRVKDTDPSGSNIITIANKICEGNYQGFFKGRSPKDEVIVTSPLNEMPPDSKTHFVEAKDRHGITAFAKKWYDKHYAPIDKLLARPLTLQGNSFDGPSKKLLSQIFAALSDAKLLCITKEGPSGVAAINSIIHEHRSRLLKYSDATWAPGEPVLVTSNNYRIQVMNGDIGVILSVRQGDGSLRKLVIFERPDDYAAFSPAQFGDALMTAYATTVHKAQGGETKHVALLLPLEENNINSRQAIYTAVTRASQSVVIVGRQDNLKQGMETKVRRLTLLAGLN
jgi:exodeoxyribonuclease V alpha subunit